MSRVTARATAPTLGGAGADAAAAAMAAAATARQAGLVCLDRRRAMLAAVLLAKVVRSRT